MGPKRRRAVSKIGKIVDAHLRKNSGHPLCARFDDTPSPATDFATTTGNDPLLCVAMARAKSRTNIVICCDALAWIAIG